MLRTIASADTAPNTLASYVSLGTLHIATGWDHLAFVVALLLLAGSLREVASLVTGFTIGHSLTLGLAVLGVVRPDTIAVEVLIGFSIALVAAASTPSAPAPARHKTTCSSTKSKTHI